MEGPRPTAYILIGHQYTGKSTWVKETLLPIIEPYNKEHGRKVQIHNIDKYLHRVLDALELKYDEEGFSIGVNKANILLNSDYNKWLRDRDDIIFDRTNITRRARKRIVMPLIDEGYDLIAVVFPSLPDQEIEKRIAMRENQIVPLNIVQDFRARMEPLDEKEKKLYKQIFYVN